MSRPAAKRPLPARPNLKRALRGPSRTRLPDAARGLIRFERERLVESRSRSHAALNEKATRGLLSDEITEYFPVAAGS